MNITVFSPCGTGLYMSFMIYLKYENPLFLACKESLCHLTNQIIFQFQIFCDHLVLNIYTKLKHIHNIDPSKMVYV